MEQIRKWHYVEEENPYEEGEYIVTLYSGEVTAARYCIRGKCYWCDIVEEYQEYNVLYWMKMPEAPDIREAAEKIVSQINRKIAAARTTADKHKAEVDTVAINFKYRPFFEKKGVVNTDNYKWTIFGLDIEFDALPNDTDFIVFNKKQRDSNIREAIKNTNYVRYIGYGTNTQE